MSSVVSDYLTMLNYDVDLCHNAACFSHKIQENTYDLVMLDLNLPDADGLEVLKALRTSDQTLVYVISGRTDQDSRINAFELGADDFITKPFSIKELELKIRNALIRSENSANSQSDASSLNSQQFSISGVMVDLNARTMRKVGHDPIEMTRGEIELLACLMNADGNIVDRKQLIKHLSVSCNIHSQESITTLVYRLRKKFSSVDAQCPIVTVAGEGYRLERRKVV